MANSRACKVLPTRLLSVNTVIFASVSLCLNTSATQSILFCDLRISFYCNSRYSNHGCDNLLKHLSRSIIFCRPREISLKSELQAKSHGRYRKSAQVANFMIYRQIFRDFVLNSNVIKAARIRTPRNIEVKRRG